jgi:hypothetical protein
MKKYFSLFIFIVTVLMIITACEKDFTKFTNEPLFIGDQAFLRVMHVSPNFRAVQNKPDSFNVYVGASKVNGSLFTYNGAFPAAAINANTYAAVPSGSQAIRLSLQGVNNIDSVTIMQLDKNLEAGKYYTFFITDSLKAQQDRIWVNDINFIPTDTTQYKVRFAHMILNDSAGKKVDVYSFRQAANIFSNISPGTVTDYASIATPTTIDTISIRRSGTGFELARINGVSYVKTRLYTILFKGSPGLASGTKPRSVIVYNNR